MNPREAIRSVLGPHAAQAVLNTGFAPAVLAQAVLAAVGRGTLAKGELPPGVPEQLADLVRLARIHRTAANRSRLAKCMHGPTSSLRTVAVKSELERQPPDLHGPPVQRPPEPQDAPDRASPRVIRALPGRRRAGG